VTTATTTKAAAPPVTRATTAKPVTTATTTKAAAPPVTRATTAKPVTTTTITKAAAQATIAPDRHPYDIDGSGSVDQSDYSMILKYVLAKLNGQPVTMPDDFYLLADVNKDGVITEADAKVIRRYLNS
ncbi:MAG: dockerin type I repeat-containing protein, partial [Oscillospiraceae bacterium]|nr:dockerin type I repeat-containing protein [Oscillospiraceae bacterium]